MWDKNRELYIIVYTIGPILVVSTRNIYTIICLKNMSPFANCRSQFLPDRLGRCLKLAVSSESISCHEFASQFGLEFVIREKKKKPIVNTESPACCLFRMQMSLYDWTNISPGAPNSTAITAYIFLRIYIASPQHLNRSLFAFVLCFFTILNQTEFRIASSVAMFTSDMNAGVVPQMSPPPHDL